MTTSKTSTERTDHSQTPTSSSEDSRAKTSPTPVRGEDSTETDPASGGNTTERFATWNQDTQSWRTRQQSMFEDSDLFSDRWPRSGMMRNGTCYRQEPLVRDIKETAHSWWPTPLANDHKGGTEKPRSDGDRSYELRHLLKSLFGGTSPNPPFVEELMGFPIGWTELGGSETR
jgi:hypothetical protein